MTPQSLSCATGASLQLATLYQPIIDNAAGDFGILNAARMAAFLAQVGHESEGLSHTLENLNYSEEGLRANFGSHFAENEFASFAREPEWIANRVYSNRMGNGDEASGDGWKFRGRGLLQTTGRANYEDVSQHLATDFIENPDWLCQPEYAVRSAMWFWQSHNLNELADNGNFERITRVINGGLTGQSQRLALYRQAQEALG